MNDSIPHKTPKQEKAQTPFVFPDQYHTGFEVISNAIDDNITDDASREEIKNILHKSAQHILGQAQESPNKQINIGLISEHAIELEKVLTREGIPIEKALDIVFTWSGLLHSIDLLESKNALSYTKHAKSGSPKKLPKVGANYNTDPDASIEEMQVRLSTIKPKTRIKNDSKKPETRINNNSEYWKEKNLRRVLNEMSQAHQYAYLLLHEKLTGEDPDELTEKGKAKAIARMEIKVNSWTEWYIQHIINGFINGLSEKNFAQISTRSISGSDEYVIDQFHPFKRISLYAKRIGIPTASAFVAYKLVNLTALSTMVLPSLIPVIVAVLTYWLSSGIVNYFTMYTAREQAMVAGVHNVIKRISDEGFLHPEKNSNFFRKILEHMRIDNGRTLPKKREKHITVADLRKYIEEGEERQFRWQRRVQIGAAFLIAGATTWWNAESVINKISSWADMISNWFIADAQQVGTTDNTRIARNFTLGLEEFMRRLGGFANWNITSEDFDTLCLTDGGLPEGSSINGPSMDWKQHL